MLALPLLTSSSQHPAWLRQVSSGLGSYAQRKHVCRALRGICSPGAV